MLLVGQDVDPGVADDVPDVTDQDGEDEDAHQPGGRHENDLGDVGRLLVLADRRRSLGGEIEAPEKVSWSWVLLMGLTDALIN